MGSVSAWLTSRSIHQDVARDVIGRMSTASPRTGPAGVGDWIDVPSGVALALTRSTAATIRTPGGPVTSPDGRWVVCLDGGLSGVPDEPGADPSTATAVALTRWGVEAALERLVGPFALVAWDRDLRHLHLARDRMGERPLHLAELGPDLIVASDLHGLCAHPGFDPSIDRDALMLLLRHGYIPAPHTIHRNARQLLPGEHFEIDATGHQPRIVGATRYWSLWDVATEGLEGRTTVDTDVLLDEFDQLLAASLDVRLSDPDRTAVLLSGGVDSSLVAAAVADRTTGPVRTVTVGFEGEAYDEIPYARSVAELLGADHTEHRMTGAEARKIVPRLAATYDQPFADSSQIATLLLAELTRRSVPVALTGDGPDGLFAGAGRYLFHDRIGRRLLRIPYPVRRVAGLLLDRAPARAVERLVTAGARLAGGDLVDPRGVRGHRLADVLSQPTAEGMHRSLDARWREPERLVIGGIEPATGVAAQAATLPVHDPVERLLYRTLVTSLPNDDLTKFDRAGMGVDLEVCTPFVDHRLVAFAWRVPVELKLRDGHLKWLLREAFARRLPRELLERPEMGFSPPVGRWLRGPLRDWAEDLLDPHRIDADGYLRSGPIRRVWDLHVAGSIDAAHQLWTVLAFQSWHEQFRRTASPTAEA